MYGGSYVGATQYLAAIAKPPHLVGIRPNYTASNYHDGWTYQDGAFEQWFNESWTTELAENTLSRRIESGGDALAWSQTLPLWSYPVLEAPSAARLAPYLHSTGSRTPTTTTIGSNGQSKNTTRRFKFRYSALARGTTFF